MEQNLSERERKQRLTIGVIFEAIALGTFFVGEDMFSAAFFAIGGLGFIANYFTCFCGTKKIFKNIKVRL